MKIDEYGCIVMEQTGWPGSIGDSCAETARFEHMRMLLGDYVSIVNLERFVTELGYVRHPTAPDGWRESDFSSDQALPLYLAFNKGNPVRALQMERRVKRDGYKTGNRKLVSPGLFGAIVDSKIIMTIAVLGQALLFKLPYRWSDSKKGFERNDDNSGDYLNWIHLAVYIPQFLRKAISPNLLMEKVRAYYKPEPDSEWIVRYYEQLIVRYWL